MRARLPGAATPAFSPILFEVTQNAAFLPRRGAQGNYRQSEAPVPFETGGELPHVIGVHPRRVFPVSYQENTLLFVGGVDGQDAHHHKICWERLRTSRR